MSDEQTEMRRDQLVTDFFRVLTVLTDATKIAVSSLFSDISD
jgi:hypothetical protein